MREEEISLAIMSKVLTINLLIEDIQAFWEGCISREYQMGFDFFLIERMDCNRMISK